MFPPKKDKGIGVMIAFGKPKGEAPPSLKSPGEPDDDEKDVSHAEPDDDQMGGPSDHDADNKIAQYATELVGVPEIAHPLGALLEALCKVVRGSGSYDDASEPEQDRY